jgi:PAS domain S-box-containing protein
MPNAANRANVGDPEAVPLAPGYFALFSAAYALAAALGQWLVLVPGHGATFWPPSGLYVAVLLQCEKRHWPRLVLAALPAEIAITVLVYHLPVSVSIAVFLGNTLAALCGASLVRYWCGAPFHCHGLRDVLALTLFAALVSPFISATVGATTLAIAEIDPFIKVWPLWWIGDAVGVLIVAPLVTMILRGRAVWQGVRLVRWAEAAALLACLLLAAHLIFSGHFPLAYIALPPLLWAALRFGMPGAALAMTVMTAMAVQYTASGYGMFANPKFTAGERSLLMQSFLGIVGVSTLVLAALINQRETAFRALRRARDELNDRVMKRTAALTESEERLRLALEAAHAGTWEGDLSSGVFTASARAITLQGLPPGTPMTHDKALAIIHPKDQPHLIAAFRRTMETGAPFRLELRVPQPDGSMRWLASHAELRRGPAGRRLVGLVQDITDRKRIEEELQRYVVELKAADRQKDDFIAMLSHEMRNPLAPVLNAVQILRVKGPQDPEMVWCGEIIDRQVRQMARLLDDLLDISRITRDKLELRRHPVELGPVINMAVETSRPLIAAGRHEFVLDVGAQPIMIDADSARIAQVIANLLNNAAKYSEAGAKITLAVELERAAHNGKQSQYQTDVLIRITDTGIGIPAENLPRIFDPFVQVDHTSDKTHGGLGIGLALAKRLIEMHGGTIAVASEGLGRGSQFTIRLPTLARPAVAEAQTDRLPAPSSGKRRVLVVDDLKMNADSLSMLLEMAGNEVSKAYSGREALDKAEAVRPDIILMDLGMPGMDGFEATRRIRERFKHRKLVMIAVSGWGQKEVRTRSIEAGFDAHITKPVDFPDLEKLMARLAD